MSTHSAWVQWDKDFILGVMYEMRLDRFGENLVESSQANRGWTIRTAEQILYSHVGLHKLNQAGGGGATFDILEMINYVQLTSQTALFKCHHRTLLGMCLHTKATGLHIQEAAHSRRPLKAPFFAFLTVHSSSVPSFAAWTVFQTLHSSPLCFSSVTITYSMSLHRLSLHGTCHSFPLLPYPCIWLIKHRSHC